jgi:hypothetical protein
MTQVTVLGLLFVAPKRRMIVTVLHGGILQKMEALRSHCCQNLKFTKTTAWPRHGDTHGVMMTL